MLRSKIDEIRRIVRALEPVEHPAEKLSAFRSQLSAVSGQPSANEDELAALFEARMNALRGPGDVGPAVIHAADSNQAAQIVAELCHGVPASEIIRQDDDQTRLERRDYRVGITGASALIASTGSVIIELPTAHDAWASLLVDRHIVVAGRDQLLPDLPAYYDGLSERLAAGERLANQVCITGCSRTADIEKVLVVPAHGPRQVRVLLSRAPLDWAEIATTPGR